jgi:transposase-like protein
VALDQSALIEVLDALTAAEVDDRIRQAAQTIYQALIEAELTSVIGAAPNQRTPERLAQRNGHRPRLVTTTAGDLELRLPKLRAGSFFPSLLERRRRVDQALFAVVMEAYLHGVSTRKVDDLVRALGADSGISKSEVSRICADLDAEVAAFGDRSLAGQAFPYIFVDATYARPGSTGGWSPRPWWWPVGCAGMAAARSSASPLATARMAPSGPRSCARSRPAGWLACNW